MSLQSFESLGLIEPILRALKLESYEAPTPIQEKTIPPLLAGRDLIGCAQTGTGKTAAFAIPILQNLYRQRPAVRGHRAIRALVLTPTRELAAQIGDSFTAYGRFTGLRNTVIFGGVNQKRQVDALTAGVDILVATPGRLLDLMGQGLVHLMDVEYFVLDEADRMLDMGFVHDVRRITGKLPEKRQTMLFSATMPDAIEHLALELLHDPVEIAAQPKASTVERINQTVYFVPKRQKKDLLIYLLRNEPIESALVFSRTKHGANHIVQDLVKNGIQADAIHGNKSQNARELALSRFKSRKTRVLVATDIAARGLDIDELSHVFNYDLPEVPETYVHRIGRTGRAGLGGTAIAFCDEEELKLLRDIEKLIHKNIPVVEEHPYALSPEALKAAPSRPAPSAGHFARRPSARGGSSRGQQGRPRQPVSQSVPHAAEGGLTSEGQRPFQAGRGPLGQRAPRRRRFYNGQKTAERDGGAKK